MNFVAYGSTVDIDPGELSRFFLLQLPLKGCAKVRCGTVAADVKAGSRGSILSPTLGTRMTWNEGCEKLIVLIRREALEAQFEALTHAPMQTIEFETGVELSDMAGQAILRHAHLMLDAAEASDCVPDAYRTLLRDGLTTLLLSKLPSSVSAIFARPIPSADPIAVRRAQEFMAANAEHAISMAEIAAASGVSLRSLQDAYRKARGVTLGEGLLALRLDRFRRALLSMESHGSVADAAFAAGFGHLGRAAAAYRERYGEAPSETLRRRR